MNLVQLFRDYFEYKDGELYWKITAGTRGIAGNKASTLRKDGYYGVTLKKTLYLTHRVIFAIVHGYLPEVVDHKNHNRSDNRIENLRAADNSFNIWNSRISSANSSGVKGVRITSSGKFEARVAVHGKTIQVGTFHTIEEAEMALRSVREKEHGCFSCHG